MTDTENQNTAEQNSAEEKPENNAVVSEVEAPPTSAKAEVIGAEVGPRSQRGANDAVEDAGVEDAVAQAKAETLRMRDQMLRIAADFDNFRKRSRRELDDAVRRGKEDLLRELLPVFDNLDRAVSHAEQATDAQSVADGVKIVLRQFQDTVGRLGVARVKSVGEAFDPNVHEAIQQIEVADKASGTVVAEVQAGYTWDERLVRAAMVVVAKAPAAASSNESE
jgi:molecular chaperone GrpE